MIKLVFWTGGSLWISLCISPKSTEFVILQKKKELVSQGHEAVSDDVVAQLHLDEKALQLFLWADTEDRNANFNKYVNFNISIHATGLVFREHNRQFWVPFQNL